MKRLDRKYEGPEVLAELLARSGCELTVDEVREELWCALEEGTPAGEVIGLLWELEPRFADADAARRTFSNLFGLFDELERALAAEGAELVQLEPVEPDADAPLTTELVESRLDELERLAPHERRRWAHRFDNLQSDQATFLASALESAGIGDLGQTLALDLALECWWLWQQARGDDQTPSPDLATLEAAWRAGAEVPDTEPEPALANLVSATLWEHAASDDDPLPDEDVAAIERALAAIRVAMAR